MVNSIDFLKQTKSLNQDTSLLSSENQTVKDKPSLFDSLLSGNKTTTTQNSNNTEELSTDLKAQSTNSALKEEIGKTKENLNSIKNKEEQYDLLFFNHFWLLLLVVKLLLFFFINETN